MVHIPVLESMLMKLYLLLDVWNVLYINQSHRAKENSSICGK